MPGAAGSPGAVLRRRLAAQRVSSGARALSRGRPRPRPPPAAPPSRPGRPSPPRTSAAFPRPREAPFPLVAFRPPGASSPFFAWMPRPRVARRSARPRSPNLRWGLGGAGGRMRLSLPRPRPPVAEPCAPRPAYSAGVGMRSGRLPTHACTPAAAWARLGEGSCGAVAGFFGCISGTDATHTPAAHRHRVFRVPAVPRAPHERGAGAGRGRLHGQTHTASERVLRDGRGAARDSEEHRKGGLRARPARRGGPCSWGAGR